MVTPTHVTAGMHIAENPGVPPMSQAAIDAAHLEALQDPANPQHQHALSIHSAAIESIVGTDPLSGAETWPDGLNAQALPGEQDPPVWDIPRSEPLRGWRLWSVKRGRLAPPMAAHPALRTGRVKHGLWQPGVNSSVQDYCAELDPASPAEHPLGDCHCGFRVMQSPALLHAYVALQYDFAASCGVTIGAHAVAAVNIWGRVTRGETVPDDWPWTARAQYAELAGPIYLCPSREPQRRKLEAYYGTPSPTDDLDWTWWELRSADV
ncbi:MAG: hypothetical protein WA966_01295 [Ornithinimicrobium sp.]